MFLSSVFLAIIALSLDYNNKMYTQLSYLANRRSQLFTSSDLFQAILVQRLIEFNNSRALSLLDIMYCM